MAVEEGRAVGVGSYVLTTAAYNEEANIGKTIASVVAQTVRPARWVIVSDGSSDRTDAIVREQSAGQEWIRFLRVERAPGRSFGSKVRALHAGSRLLEDIRCEFVGNLDADVSIPPEYFEHLLEKFEARPGLGIAAGFVYEEKDGEFANRRSNRTYSVAHAGQLVRQECYQAIGGYAVLEYGGEDWHAQVSAQMRGWEVEAFPELRIFHHRHTGEGDNLLRHKFRQGRMDYSLGSDPLFEVLKCLERLPEKPLIIGNLARLSGYFWSAARRDRKPVADEFVAFLRAEQRKKVAGLVRRAGKSSAGAGMVPSDGAPKENAGG
jgi:hypothetical protein